MITGLPNLGYYIHFTMNVDPKRKDTEFEVHYLKMFVALSSSHHFIHETVCACTVA